MLNGRRERGMLACVLVLTVCFLAFGAMAQAVQDDPAAEVTSRFMVQPGQEITLRVTYPDGEPLAETPVSVWNVDRKEQTAKALTDAKGQVTLAGLEEGEYVILVADRLWVDLAVTEKAAILTGPIEVVVPHGQSAFAVLSDGEKENVILAQFGGEEGEGEPLFSGTEGGGLDWWGLLRGSFPYLVGAAGRIIVADIFDCFAEEEEVRVVVSPPR